MSRFHAFAVLMAGLGVAFAKKIPASEKHVTHPSNEACSVSVIVDGQRKLGGFVLKQLESELNRILASGGANIHATLVTGGNAEYALHIRSAAPQNHVQGDVLGQTSKEDPRSSFLFIESIENTWRRIGTLPRGGRGIVYARVYAHEIAAHGILGWAHSQPGDRSMGFLGSGRNWGDFLFNDEDNSMFEFSPKWGTLLNQRCRLSGHAQNLNSSSASP